MRSRTHGRPKSPTHGTDPTWRRTLASNFLHIAPENRRVPHEGQFSKGKESVSKEKHTMQKDAMD